MSRYLQPPEIDFVAPAKWSASFILILMLLVAACAALLTQNLKVREQLQQQQIQRKQQAQPIAPVISKEVEKNISEQYQALQQINQQLKQNLELFEQLENCANPDWRYLNITPNLAEKQATLTIETSNITTLNQGLACLEENHIFQQIELISQQRITDKNQTAIQIELKGK